MVGGGKGATKASTGPVGCVKCLLGDNGGDVVGGEETKASAGPPGYVTHNEGNNIVC